MEGTPTSKQEDVTQTAEAKDTSTPYTTDESYGTYRKLDETEFELTNKQTNSTKNLKENGEEKTNNEKFVATDKNKPTNGVIKAPNSEVKTTNEDTKTTNGDDKTNNDEVHEKMYNYVQNIMLSKSGTDLAKNEKNGTETGLLPESTTVTRFSPIWKQVINLFIYK